MTNVYDFSAQDIDGKKVPLKRYKGKALLIVNTASQCGFTPQYAGLEKLHRDLSDRGFEVLGFPCNQFGAQEPGDAEEIKNFCSLKYDVTFPMFAKVDVNGSDTHPLFEYLKKAKPGLLGSQNVKWNFTKFLVDKEGNPVARYAPQESPESLRKDIEKLLG
ncbi:MAG: glutathione peroxidase [Rhodoblastus sp.]|nr:glutathione peroxidase [Rhodoblastus sp.]